MNKRNSDYGPQIWNSELGIWQLDPAYRQICWSIHGQTLLRRTTILPYRLVKWWHLDPAWPYNDIKKHRKDNPQKLNKRGVGAAGNYKVCSWDYLIAELGPTIKSISAPNAYMTCWVTVPILAKNGIMDGQLKEFFEACGFRCVGIAQVWCKTNQSTSKASAHPLFGGDHSKGIGFYIPGNIEICLLLVRGKPIHINSGYRKPNQVTLTPDYLDELDMFYREDTILEHPKLRHSAKPPIVETKLSAWLDPHLRLGEKVELFARAQTPGWHCYGNEVSAPDLIDDLTFHEHKIPDYLWWED